MCRPRRLSSANATWVTPLPLSAPGAAQQWLLHIHNYDGANVSRPTRRGARHPCHADANARTRFAPAAASLPQAFSLPSVTFDGVPLGKTAPSLPQVVPPGGHVVLSFFTPAPKSRGDLYTLVLGESLGYGGRTPDTRFPIEVCVPVVAVCARAAW